MIWIARGGGRRTGGRYCLYGRIRKEEEEEIEQTREQLHILISGTSFGVMKGQIGSHRFGTIIRK